MNFGEVLSVFWYSLRLDVVAASYLILFPFVLLLVQSLYSPRWLNHINKIYTLFFLLVYSLITITEVGIYDEWKTKLPAKALMYLNHPGEIYNSSPTGTFFLLVIILILMVAVGFYLYNRIFYSNLIKIKRNWIFTLLFLFITPGFILIGLRGGVQQIPIVQSNSYFSKHNFLNIAATNSGYNFLHSYYENQKNFGKNPFIFFPQAEANATVNKLFEVEKDTTLSFLTTERPNIILFIMESWSADLFETLGGIEGITPEVKKLGQDGIFFTNMWANGTRSEQGMASIFSGFPAHPISSITIQPDKYRQLPSMVHILKEQDYFTSFYFGGQLIYGNIKGYVYFNEFDRVTEIYDFDNNIPQGKLCVHDEFVFERQLSEVSEDHQPFFSTIFSSSTHSPYDMPMNIKGFLDDKFDNLYVNSAYYADSCIGDYIRKARNKDWYDNTLFIIIADHSRETYRHWNYYSSDYHKIFMLFYGNVINEEFRGTIVSKFGSQVDLSATLLSQLNLDSKEFKWSKNLMNPYSQDFASVAFEEGIGWITPYGKFFYDKRTNRYYDLELPKSYKEQTIKDGKSFLQVIFQQYMDF